MTLCVQSHAQYSSTRDTDWTACSQKCEYIAQKAKRQKEISFCKYKHKYMTERNRERQADTCRTAAVVWGSHNEH